MKIIHMNIKQCNSNEFKINLIKKCKPSILQRGILSTKVTPDILHYSLFPFKMLFAWIFHNDDLCYGLDFKITGQ